MAGLKKSKDKSSPNTILVVFLIFFVLLSIGLGVATYYGYEGQESLRIAKKNADKETEKIRADRGRHALVATIGRIVLGNTPAPDDLTNFVNDRNDMTKNPEDAKEQKAAFEFINKVAEAHLGTWSEAEKKFEKTFPEVIKAALDESKKNKAILEETKKEYEAFKANYEALRTKTEASIAELQALIKKGNDDALAAAKVVNNKFPGVEKLLVDQQKANAALNTKMTDELKDLQDQLTRSKVQYNDLEKQMNNRALGIAATPQAGAGRAHALMLDISRGIPLWDKAIGKILRVDPATMTVQIDQGGKRGIQPEMSFNVFASNPYGQADRSLKGTLEVVRVVNDNLSLCKITALYDDNGYPVPIVGDRVRAVRDIDTMLREGDLLFHAFFDMHVVIAGNVNYNGLGGDSPAAQHQQLLEFAHLLRKNNVHVDGYVNLLNGQTEGIVTPKTRLLIVGPDGKLNSTADESARITNITAAREGLMKQAGEQGMFVISAENFAAVIGYRPPTGLGTKDAPVLNFRPSVPAAGQGNIQGQAAPVAPAAVPAEKKE